MWFFKLRKFSRDSGSVNAENNLNRGGLGPNQPVQQIEIDNAARADVWLNLSTLLWTEKSTTSLPGLPSQSQRNGTFNLVHARRQG